METVIGLVLIALATVLMWQKNQRPSSPPPRSRGNSSDVETIIQDYLQESSRLTREHQQNMKVLAEKELTHLESVAVEQAQAHISKLHAKSKQLTHFDDYGNLIDEPWRRELAYFVETVVLPKQSHRWVEITDEMKGSLIATVESEVFAYDLSSVAGEDDAYRADMHGVDFEVLVRSMIESRGFTVQPTQTTGDQGVDLIVNTAKGAIAIQCKRSRTTIGNKAVQEAFSGASFRSITTVWVVSDAPFSTSARQLATSLGVRLIDFRNMDEHLAPLAHGAL